MRGIKIRIRVLTNHIYHYSINSRTGPRMHTRVLECPPSARIGAEPSARGVRYGHSRQSRRESGWAAPWRGTPWLRCIAARSRRGRVFQLGTTSACVWPMGPFLFRRRGDGGWEVQAARFAIQQETPPNGRARSIEMGLPLMAAMRRGVVYS